MHAISVLRDFNRARISLRLQQERQHDSYEMRDVDEVFVRSVVVFRRPAVTVTRRLDLGADAPANVQTFGHKMQP